MESLPSGANFKRAKMLWEIGLHIAGDPKEPYMGNRDTCITVGSGSGDRFRPYLKLSTGSALLASAVVRGDLDMAIVNPSGMLTQAYRGAGVFSEPLPVRVVACYPSWDRFACLIHRRTGLSSIAEIKVQRFPLRLCIREDPAHSTRVLVDQMLAAYGFSLADIESWGGSLFLVGGPGDKRRLDALEQGTIDAVFDEGLRTWVPRALDAGLEPVQIDEAVLEQLEALGWRRAMIPAGRYPNLTTDHLCIDFGGWPLYTRASLPEDVVYKVCAAINARNAEIPWESGAYTGMGQLGQDTEATPLDVPLHPGAARWHREQGFSG